MKTMKMIFKYLIYHKGQKGIALVWMALMLTVLFMLAGLGIDIGYMYYVRNQLQTAADAAALAGAVELNGPPPTPLSIANARANAVMFAANNSAAGTSVVIASDGSNTLSNANDITVGNWDPTQNPKYDPNRTPINALQVAARRTSGSPGGAVRVFLGQIFKMMGGDWSFMSARAEAIAAKLPRASSFVAMGSTACDGLSLSSCSESNPFNFPNVCAITPPRELRAAPTSGSDYENKFGWTTLLTKYGNSFDLVNLMCSNSPNQDICSAPGIYGISGVSASVLRNFESLMFDPNFDAAHKEYLSGNVTGWWVMIPWTNERDPMSPPPPDPQSVIGYVLMRIIAICATGGGSPCRPYSAPSSLCSPYPNNRIVIDRISCIPCGSVTPGLKAVLVR